MKEEIIIRYTVTQFFGIIIVLNINFICFLLSIGSVFVRPY